MLAQELAELGPADRVFAAVVLLEDQLTLGTLELVAGRGRRPAKAAVAVEVHDVVGPGVGLQLGAQLLEGRRAQHLDLGGQSAFVDELDQRARDAAIGDIALVGPGSDEKDADAIARERLV